MGGWLLLTAAAMVYLIARYARVRRFDRELRQVITLRPDASGVDRYLADYHEQAQKWRRAHLEPAAAAGLTAYEAFYALSMIDPDVLRAADRVSEDFSSWAELQSWQQSIQAMDPAARAGAIHQLVGHTGELKVAAHLVAEGHAVEFPEAPNQAGYDLLVDGSPLQVKTTIDPALIHEHLSSYPDVPVVVPQELAGLAGEPGVVVDPNLSHADVTHSVHQTLEGVGVLGSIPAHVPWMTLAVASYREIVLLARGWTDLASALQNLAADVVGVGLGGAAGVKAGLAIGFAVAGPAGAAVAAILGALAGGSLGKAVANWFKMRHVRGAYERFRQALCQAAQAYVDALAAHAEALRRRRQALWRGARPVLLRLLWPSRSDVARAYVARRLHINQHEARTLYEQLKRKLELSHDRDKAAAEVLLHFPHRPLYSRQLDGALRRLAEARETLVTELRKLGRQVT